VQHIAHGFIGGLAEWLNASCDLRVKVAEAPEPLREHSVYLAPDDRHLGVGRSGCIELSDGPPISGFRPSATYLFQSAARALGPGIIAVVLTGMGNDGVAGLAAIKSAGGMVIAQDQETSVVYGMPGEAVATGAVDLVVPVDEVGPQLRELALGAGAGGSR
jgi:two-component system chemotaxis response regulator CheB